MDCSETLGRCFEFKEAVLFLYKVVVMKIKNLAGIAILVVAVAFAIQLIPQNNAQANPPLQSTQTQAVRPPVEFARLLVSESGEEVTWLIGGNTRIRTESVTAAYRRLGGTGQGSFSDLLNQIFGRNERQPVGLLQTRVISCGTNLTRRGARSSIGLGRKT